ncbi:hypothetical protein FRB95_014216 [Tulasnella sp. JGI-2019a]|nr:hypothetical protein FRB95_014216 [Tulasnella sp. JGI-2019a]
MFHASLQALPPVSRVGVAYTQVNTFYSQCLPLGCNPSDTYPSSTSITASAASVTPWTTSTSSKTSTTYSKQIITASSTSTPANGTSTAMTVTTILPIRMRLRFWAAARSSVIARSIILPPRRLNELFLPFWLCKNPSPLTVRLNYIAFAVVRLFVQIGARSYCQCCRVSPGPADI